MGHEVVPVRIGTTLTERQVVLFRSALIAVAGDPDVHLDILPQPVGLAVEGGLSLCVHLTAVGVEENLVAGRLDQVLLAAGGASTRASGRPRAGAGATGSRGGAARPGV